MEAIQFTENSMETVTAPIESNRLLKRNIGELAIDGKINGEFYSVSIKIRHNFIWF